MAQKQTPAAGAESAAAGSAPPAAGDLSAAIKALNQAAQSLATSAAQLKQMTQPVHRQTAGTGAMPGTAAETAPAAGPAEGTGPEQDKEAQRFYERLEQAGQLVDVDDQADLSSLPPRITHVRRPDGSIERIGFSAFPHPRG